MHVCFAITIAFFQALFLLGIAAPVGLIVHVYILKGRWKGTVILLVPGLYILYAYNIFYFILFMVLVPILGYVVFFSIILVALMHSH
jgi:hypothetical protein